jgi:hypothetical protein
MPRGRVSGTFFGQMVLAKVVHDGDVKCGRKEVSTSTVMSGFLSFRDRWASRS